MPVNQNDSMSATAVIGYHLYISHDLNTLKECMSRSHIDRLDSGLATDTIRHHPWQSVLVCRFPYCIRNHM